MTMDFSAPFPRQNLPYKSKCKNWCKACVDWASSRTYFHYSPVRQNVVNMKVNYDLMNGVIHMEDVVSKEVEWLWYPYIPYGKITIIEGDPGEGKTTLVLMLAAALSRGLPLPCDDDKAYEPIHIIY